MTTKLMAFCASTRKDSFNRKLFSLVVTGARHAGAEVTVVDLKDYPMPIYNGDDEEISGMPESAVKLLDILAAHQGLLVVTPEYNGFFPPLLKNTLDWMSRPDPSGQSGLRHFQGKVAAMASASPSGFGGVRSLLATRQYLTILGLTVIPDQVTISQAHKAFNENGELQDAKLQASALALGARLTAVTGKLAS